MNRPDSPAAEPPTTPEALLARLAGLGIAAETVRHAPVFTVAEAQAQRASLPHGGAAGHIKNLFLRNRKEEMWLVVLEESRRLDLAALGERLGAGKLSFGSAERLKRHLGVEPGAVTPFAVISDKAGRVRVALERGLLAFPRLYAHPLVNSRSTAIAPADLLRFLEAESHPPLLLDFRGEALI